MLFQLARFGTGNSGFDGGFARINLFFWFRISLLLFQFARFGSGNSGFDGGFARINLFFWFRISLLLFQLARFGTGNSGFDGGLRGSTCSSGSALACCCSSLRAWHGQ
ncbi:Uncharacterised protein [Escherichia coli]|uniref:Uncharacterized protein n=1 Tax=Escherichia coli TaxID=562 RepID=A0A377BB56_ECOLX|nr:Uncharacterised protein [Escherichia coli]